MKLVIEVVNHIIDYLYATLLAISGTGLLVSVYLIKTHTLITESLDWYVEFLSIFVWILSPVLLTWFSILFSKYRKLSSISTPIDTKTINVKNQDFLPVYLGYIFIALSIPADFWGEVDIAVLVCIYLILLVFVIVSKTYYFNPIYFLFAYNFYQCKSKQGTTIHIISKWKFEKDSEKTFKVLREISDTVYFDREEYN